MGANYSVYYGGSRTAGPKRPVKIFGALAASVASCATCILSLGPVMFKIQLPATRVIARRLYSSRGGCLSFFHPVLLILMCHSDAFPLQLCEGFGQVPNSRSPVTLQAS